MKPGRAVQIGAGILPRGLIKNRPFAKPEIEQAAGAHAAADREFLHGFLGLELAEMATATDAVAMTIRFICLSPCR